MVSHKELFDDYRARCEKIKQMGGSKGIKIQHSRGKWTARERVEYFFDPGTFTEIGMHVKHRTTHFGMDKKEVAAEGVITGSTMVKSLSGLLNLPRRMDGHLWE